MTAHEGTDGLSDPGELDISVQYKELETPRDNDGRGDVVLVSESPPENSDTRDAQVLRWLSTAVGEDDRDAPQDSTVPSVSQIQRPSTPPGARPLSVVLTELDYWLRAKPWYAGPGLLRTLLPLKMSIVPLNIAQHYNGMALASFTDRTKTSDREADQSECSAHSDAEQGQPPQPRTSESPASLVPDPVTDARHNLAKWWNERDPSSFKVDEHLEASDAWSSSSESKYT